MAKFSYAMQHVPGKLLYTANTLSQVPLPIFINDTSKSKEMENFIVSYKVYEILYIEMAREDTGGILRYQAILEGESN